MTREEAKQLLPVITAFAEGKEIQYKTYSGGDWFNGGKTFAFENGPQNYRIKPTPKYRPWKAEEVPLGAFVRNEERDKGKPPYWGIVAVFSDDRVQLGYAADAPSFSELLAKFKYSTDGGRTWNICGVLDND